jgi:hypothetical protein
MFKKPMFLNGGLLIISGLLIYNVSQMWLSFSPLQEINGVAQQPEVKENLLHNEKKGAPQLASLSSYDVIGKQNVFRPERREWKPPPSPPPASKKPAPRARKEPEPLAPPPLPDPALMGIILEEDGEKLAIMQGHRREKAVVATRRGRRGVRRNIPDRIVADRVRTYHEGDTISEGVILEIQEDKVIIEKEGRKIEIAIGNKSSEKVVAPSPKKKKSSYPYRTPRDSSSPTYAPKDELPFRTSPNLNRRKRLEKLRSSRGRFSPRRKIRAPKEEEEE